MQTEQYNEYLNSDPKFTDYCIKIDPRQIVEFRQVARSKGHEAQNINRYYVQFERGTKQLVPVSVVPIGFCKENNWTLYAVCDGITRTKAGQKLVLQQVKENKVKEKKTVLWTLLACTYQHEVLNYTTDQWEDFSDRGNDTIGAEPNTDDDMKEGIQRRVKSGRLDTIVSKKAKELKLGNITLKKNREKYLDLAAEFFVNKDYGIYRNSRRTKVWFKNRILEILKAGGNIVDKIEWNDDEWVLGEYISYGGTKYNEKKNSKLTSNNEKVYILRAEKHVSPQVVGNCLTHKANNPSVDITVIFNFNDLANKSDEDVNKTRVDVCKVLVDRTTQFNIGITRIVATAQTENELKLKGSDRVVEYWSSTNGFNPDLFPDESDDAVEIDAVSGQVDLGL